MSDSITKVFKDQMKKTEVVFETMEDYEEPDYIKTPFPSLNIMFSADPHKGFPADAKVTLSGKSKSFINLCRLLAKALWR